MRTERQRGMTFVEVLVSMGILVIASGGFVMAVLSAHSAADSTRRRDMVRAQAYKYMERLGALPYGSNVDPTATTAQVEELFDDDGIVTGAGGLTLRSVETPIGAAGWRFRVDRFEVDGVFEVEVNSDLDGNGTLLGVRGTETPTTGNVADLAGDGSTVVTLRSEGDPRLMRIEVFFEGESILRTMRAAPVEGS